MRRQSRILGAGWHKGSASVQLYSRLAGSFGSGRYELGMKRYLAFGWLWFVAASAQACTIFVLTDTNRVLFCNNEDWANPLTRIWFVPASEGRYGCAFVGFDNGWGQGGLNTKGLAYDWVNFGTNEKWDPDPRLPRIEGNPCDRMLQACATLEDAVAFFRTHYEPGFITSRILVADKTGASAIIGVKQGKLSVDRESQCRGFGYGRRTMNDMLAASSEPTVANGIRILRACAQKGPYATKYSNVFDLKSGDIFIFRGSEREPDATPNLAAELKKGAHYYDIPQIREQLKQPPRPITAMKRVVAYAFQPMPDPEPKVTAQFRRMIDDAARGQMRAADYTAEFWKKISADQKKIQGEMKALGDLLAVEFVDRSTEAKERTYWYRLEFTKATVLQILMLDSQNRIAFGDSLDLEHKASGKVQ
jgi:hypothetical protein